MDKRKIIYIDTYNILLTVLIVPLVPPEGMAVLLPSLYFVIFKIGKYISGIIVALLLIINIKNKKIVYSYTYMIIFLIFMWNFCVTVLRRGDITGCLANYYSIIVLGILIITNIEKLNIIINIIYMYLFQLVLLNGLCMFFFKNGMYISSGIEGYYANWLLGYKSSFQYYILPMLCIVYFKLASSRQRCRLGNLIAIAMAHIETIFSLNKMLLVGIIVLDIGVLYFSVLKGKGFNPYILAVVALLTNFVLVFIPIDKFLGISYFLEHLLHKNLNSGRVYLWNTTLVWIKNNLLWGYGKLDNSIRYYMYGRVAHAHNQLLEFTFQGGIVLLIIYIVLMLIAAFFLNKRKNNILSPIVAFSLFVLYIMTSVEIFTRSISAYIWLLFMFAEFIGIISKGQNDIE